MCAPKHHEDNMDGLLVFVILVILLILFFREENERHRPQPPARHPQRERRRPPLFDFDDIEEENVLRMEYGVPTLDLHEMSVREAIQKTETFLQQSRGRYRKVRIITGRGQHSFDGVPRIREAVEELLNGRTYRRVARGGCLEVTL
uniref:Smr domain-containing protein n=1 Tax=Scylla olivacea TaxID=85551 RepID=A0A0N7ZDH9_SCYOL